MKVSKKQVFSNSQLCHVWANQVQETGRNAKNSLYFSGPKIYSYGSHFLAAKFFNVKGQKIVLINSHNYSSSTAGHLSDIRSSLRGHEDILTFSVPQVNELNSQENVDYFNGMVWEKLDDILGLSRILWESAKNYKIEALENAIIEANNFFKLIGQKELILPELFKTLLREVLEEKYAKFKALNSPESMAKKEAEKLKKEQKLAVLNASKNAENIAKFRAGENVKLENLTYDLIRVQGENVMTSRFASVPLIDAVNAVKSILSGTITAGQKIGSFSFESFNNEKIIKVGCHKFELSEVSEVLKTYLA